MVSTPLWTLTLKFFFSLYQFADEIFCCECISFLGSTSADQTLDLHFMKLSLDLGESNPLLSTEKKKQTLQAVRCPTHT